jgi:Tol biopolymer transport system component
MPPDELNKLESLPAQPAPSIVDLPLGSRLGPYRIEALIGAGGMGAVFRGVDTRLGRTVAIKVSREKYSGRFVGEARAISVLNHPNICTLHDVGSTPSGEGFLVMELVEGETLRARLASGALPLEQVRRFGMQMADALAHAHKNGVIHRDLKASNVIITPDEQAKILDFGLAKQLSARASNSSEETVTNSGVVVGTPAYMAPEQILREPAGERSDIWAFGILLYEMASGVRPFHDKSGSDLSSAILNQDIPPLPPGPEGAPPAWLRSVIDRCLAKDPAQRFQSCAEVRAALEDVPAGPAQTARFAVGYALSRRRWLVLGIALAAAVLLVTGLWPQSTPTARVTQLTKEGGEKSPYLAVRGGRILYASNSAPPNQFAGEFWSTSTQGGEPKRESMPFLNPEHFAQLLPLNTPQDVVLILTCTGSCQRGEIWLAGIDGSRPRRVGEFLNPNWYTISPDLKALTKAAREGLFEVPLDGGPERLIARIDWNTPSYIFWHPSGERIGFLPLKDGPSKIWDVKKDGTGMSPLLPEFQGAQSSPNWSPDGKRLYFVSQGEIYVRGDRGWLGWMRTPKPQRLTTGSVEYSVPYEDPADPRTIYSTGQTRRGESMKLDLHTSVFEPYLNGLSAECLDYSPDGQWIAYVSYPGRELWKCRRDGSGKVLLEDGLLTAMPRWSPDGKRLAFAATRKGVFGEKHRIYTIAANGGRSELVTAVGGPGFDPNWSPDGKSLVFAPLNQEVAAQDHHISIANLETGEVRMVPGSEDLFTPRWSPDGKHLVAARAESVQPVIYDFETGRWSNLIRDIFGFPKWSQDSKYVYGMMPPQRRLVRIEVATGTVEEIRRITEFELTGNLSPGVSWTPDFEPVVLSNKSSREIFRIDIER